MSPLTTQTKRGQCHSWGLPVRRKWRRTAGSQCWGERSASAWEERQTEEEEGEDNHCFKSTDPCRSKWRNYKNLTLVNFSLLLPKTRHLSYKGISEVIPTTEISAHLSFLIHKRFYPFFLELDFMLNNYKGQNIPLGGFILLSRNWLILKNFEVCQ